MILSRLIDFLETRASLRLSVIFMMAIIPMNALVFPLVNAQVAHGSGISLAENQFYFTPALLFANLQVYGQTGRQAYLLSILVVDFLYPILYALLFSFLLTLILRAGFAPQNPFLRMQLFPFGMLIFNYIANIALVVLLVLFPAQPIWLAWIASGANTLKWCFGVFSAFALLAGIGRLLIIFSKLNRQTGE